MTNLSLPSSSISLYDFPGAVDKVREIRSLLEAALALGGDTRACRQVATKSVKGASWQNLYRKLQAWIASGRNDTVLLSHSEFVELSKRQPKTLPAEFRRWAGGQMLGNQRGSKAAYRDIIRQWELWRRTGEAQYAIPGYKTAPDCGPKGYPVSWSYKNLMEYAQPPVEELAMARIGSVEAQKYLPYIPSTRQGIRFLEYVFFDDVVHDRQCAVPGYIDPVRILQLGCLDLASACYLKFGLRPDVARDDGTRDRLKRRDMLMLVAIFLQSYGYPTEYPMHLIVERATATMSQAEAQFLHEITGGQVRVGYTSMEGQFVLAWDESKSGNPRGKGPLESWHNLFHNYQASLPGQVGKDRAHSPAALAGSNREVASLNKIALILTPEQRSRFRLPYPSLYEAHKQSLEIVERMNTRRDHELEDFGKIMLWRIKGTSMEWRPEGELATVNPAMLDHIEYLPVNETPLERLMRLSHGVTMNFPHPGAMTRFYEGSSSKERIERRQVKIKVEGRTLWFGPETAEESLPNGAEVLLHYAPVDPETVIVSCDGRYVGVWKRQLSRRGDENADALAKDLRRKQAFINQTASHVRGKMAEKLIEQERRISENAAVIEEAGILTSSTERNLSTRGNTVITPTAQAVIDEARRVSNRDAIDAARTKQARAVTESDLDAITGRTEPDAVEAAPLAAADSDEASISDIL